MPVVIKQQDFEVGQGEFFFFNPAPWTNPAHVVNAYVLWRSPSLPQRFKVPLAYATLIDVFTVAGETSVYERETRFMVGDGCVFTLIRNTPGLSSICVYVRRNGLEVPAQIRVRQINFSI